MRKYRENRLILGEKLIRRQDLKPGFYVFKEWIETQYKKLLIIRSTHWSLFHAVKQLLTMAESI